MTLQWTFVAVFLYVEIFFLCLLMLPWIRPQMWQKLFKSRLVKMIEVYSNIYVYGFAGLLFLLFFDAIREVRKYAESNMEMEAMFHTPNVDAVNHMKLFRAQRNLYISGFALFLWLVIRRTVGLIAREAQLMASAEAAMRQAKGASDAAQLMMNKKPDSTVASDNAMNEEVEVLKSTIEQLEKELKSAQTDRDAMKSQSDSLKKEYDRLLEEHSKVETGTADKKHD